MQTYNNVLHVYGLHTSKEQLLPSLGGSLHELRRVHVYLQHSTVLEQHGTHAVDIVCDSRSILVGFSDASFQLLSWQSQVRHCSTLHIKVGDGTCVASKQVSAQRTSPYICCMLAWHAQSQVLVNIRRPSNPVCVVQLKGKKSPFATGPDEQQQQYIRSRLSKRGSSGDLPMRASSDAASWQSAPSRQGSGVSCRPHHRAMHVETAF